MIACDVVRTTDIRKMQARDIQPHRDIKYSLFPRYDMLGHRQSYVSKLQATVRHAELRNREHYLIAGRVFQWIELYDELPQNDSWVWSWYPDAKRWRDAFTRYGRSAIPVLTGEFIDLDRSTVEMSSSKLEDDVIEETDDW